MTIGKLREMLDIYPADWDIAVTWDSCLWELEEDNIYHAKRYIKGQRKLIIIDADDNQYKDFWQGKED